MLPSVLLNWQYSSLLGDLSTRQLDLTATWEISNESHNIERRKLLLMELWEARYLVSQRVQSVHQLVCHLWQNFCFGLKEAGRRGALPCNSMQLA